MTMESLTKEIFLEITEDPHDQIKNIKMEAEANYSLILPELESGDVYFEVDKATQEVLSLENSFQFLRKSFEPKEKCEICCKEMAKLSIKRHMKIHEIKGKLECDFCGDFKLTKLDLSRHMKFHWSDRKYICSECKCGFSQRNLYKEHLLTHLSDIQPLQCNFCSESFQSVKILERHTLELHTKEGTFKCHQCTFTAKTYRTLYAHKIIHKQLDKKLVCLKCSREFSTLHELKEHKESEKFECEICGETFYYLIKKFNHIRKVHGENLSESMQEKNLTLFLNF